MPTYVYRRPDGTTFETFQKISDAPLTEDPETGEPVQRVISGGAGLQFKGDGFYLTDYGRKGSDMASAAKKDRDGGAEAKPAAPKPEKTAAPATTASPKADG